MTWPTSPEPTADSKPAAPPRFRDGIKWGLLAIIAVPVMRYQSLVPLFALIVLPAVAGIRAKSLRSAIGAIATLVIVIAILVMRYPWFLVPLTVLPGVAGIRAKSLRPAIGAIATAVLVLGILYGVVLFQLFRIPP